MIATLLLNDDIAPDFRVTDDLGEWIAKVTFHPNGGVAVEVVTQSAEALFALADTIERAASRLCQMQDLAAGGAA